MKHRYRNAYVWILVVGLIIRLVTMIITPQYRTTGLIPGYNDEPLHLHYVEYISEHGGWPVWKLSEDSLAYLQDEFVQPPVYYYIAKPFFEVAHAINETWGIYGVRLLSVICGLLTGILVYKAGFLWSNSPRFAASAVAAFMFMPNAIVFTSIAVNDSLAMLLGAAAIYTVLTTRQPKSSALSWLLCGLLIAGTSWAKLSGLALIPLILFTGSSEQKASDRWMIRSVVFITVMVVLTPLLIHNIKYYTEPVPGQSTPLSTDYWPEEALEITGGAVEHPWQAIKYFLRLIPTPLNDVWGSALEKGVSLAWIILWTGMLTLGIVLLIITKLQGILFIFAVLWVLIGFIWHNLHLFQVEFRLLAPAYSALSMILAKGADSLNIPLAVQCVFYCLPFIMMFIYNGV